MKRLILALLLLSSCGGILSDEQRKKMREGMKRNEIKKLSDAQITTAAFEAGKAMMAMNSAQKDSLVKNHLAKFVDLKEGDPLLSSVERQIVEAYAAGSQTGELGDNIQKLGSDSLLYTNPVLKSLPDGSKQFVYAMGIRMSKKQIVINMKN